MLFTTDARSYHSIFVARNRGTARKSIDSYLSLNTDQNKRHWRRASALSQQIIQGALIIRHSGRHFRLQRLHRKYFNPNVHDIANKKCHVLYEQIVSNECVFSKLHLYLHPFFYKIRLIIRINRRSPGSFDFLALLLFGSGSQRPAYSRGGCGTINKRQSSVDSGLPSPFSCHIGM